MDINPLISDLKKYKEELLDTIEIAMGFDELNKADVHIAHAIAEINGEVDSSRPFHQVADIYNLPLQEVVSNIRDFTNKGYKSFLIFDPQDVPDIDFESDMDSLD
jgi:hypothetical protein